MRNWSHLQRRLPGVACDCPRHLGEIVTLLVGFELYSADCALRSETDAALHQRLDEVTA